MRSGSQTIGISLLFLRKEPFRKKINNGARSGLPKRVIRAETGRHPNSVARSEGQAKANYASVALQCTAASGRVTSRRWPIPTGRRSCEEAHLALALSRGLALGRSRGLAARRGTARERTAVRLRHALLHLHL